MNATIQKVKAAIDSEFGDDYIIDHHIEGSITSLMAEGPSWCSLAVFYKESHLEVAKHDFVSHVDRHIKVEYEDIDIKEVMALIADSLRRVKVLSEKNVPRAFQVVSVGPRGILFIHDNPETVEERHRKILVTHWLVGDYGIFGCITDGGWDYREEEFNNIQLEYSPQRIGEIVGLPIPVK